MGTCFDESSGNDGDASRNRFKGRLRFIAQSRLRNRLDYPANKPRSHFLCLATCIIVYFLGRITWLARYQIFPLFDEKCKTVSFRRSDSYSTIPIHTSLLILFTTSFYQASASPCLM